MPTMTLNLDQRYMDTLDALATEQDMSKTAVLRAALRVYQTVHERAKLGQQLAFTKDGNVVPLLIPGLMAVDVPPGVTEKEKGRG